MLKQLTGIFAHGNFSAAILAFGAAPAFAQMNTGEIDGIVRDPTGAVVLNATVTAVETGTQLKYTTKDEQPPANTCWPSFPSGNTT